MPADYRKLFLKSVLGADGAAALLKAANRSKAVDRVLLPRTILAWMDLAPTIETIPGTGAPISLKKSVDGLYSGFVNLGTGRYSFSNVTSYHVAAAIALSIGDEHLGKSCNIKDLDIERLGKNIDTLAKAYSNSKALSSVADIRKRASFYKKEAGTGTTAKPIAPDMPKAPEAKAPKPSAIKAPKGAPAGTPKAPKPKASHTLKLSETESRRACRLCGISQISDNRFTGCYCFRDLKKSATTTKQNGTFFIRFRDDVDEESFLTLLETVRGQ